MAVIQHKAVASPNLHVPRAHKLTSHSAQPAADHGKFLKADIITGAPVFSNITVPSYAGDPVDPINSFVWYDSVNDRLRVKLAIGIGTLNVTLDP